MTTVLIPNGITPVREFHAKAYRPYNVSAKNPSCQIVSHNRSIFRSVFWLMDLFLWTNSWTS